MDVIFPNTFRVIGESIHGDIINGIRVSLKCIGSKKRRSFHRCTSLRTLTLISFFLSLSHQIQQIEELRKADRNCFRALNPRLTHGAQRRHAEGHGDAVIAA